MMNNKRVLAIAIGTVLGAPLAHAQEGSATGTERLSPVVITAGGFEQDLQQAPASISVVTREELERKEVTNLADALRGIEGVNVRSLDARSGKTGNQTISLRGLPEEYTLVLIDGVRQNVSGTVAPNAFTDASGVFMPPVAAIERIEVIRGPMSTLYGSDAIGGVVNIITRQPTDEWEGAASLGHTFQSDSDFGGYSTLEGYLAGPLVDERLSMQLYTRLYERAASSIDIPGTESSLIDNRTMGQNPTSANVETFGGRLIFTPNAQDEFSLRLDTTRQTYDNSRGQLGRLTGTGDSRDNFLRGYSRELEFQRDQIRLGHRGDYDFGTWETTLTQDRVETKGRTINQGAVPDASREGGPRKLQLDTTIVDSKLVTDFDDHIVTVGGQYLRPKLEDGILPDTLSTWQYSLFVEDEWFMTDRFALTGGLRFDDNENFSSQITPRLYGVFNATDTVTLKGGVGQGFRAPYIEQITDGVIGYGDGGSTPLFGNPDLEPERSTNVEFTVAYDNYQDFSAEATVFRNELKDKIERGTGANEGIDVNIGESVVRGIELAGRYQFAPDWAFSANYTWTDSEVKKGGTAASAVGDPLASVPEHMLNARLDWQTTPRVAAFAEAEYRSSAFRPRNYHEPQDGGSAQGAYDALGGFRGFTMVNVGAAYRITENVSLNATIYNLLDKDFKDYRSYAREDTGETTFSNVYNNLYEPRRLFVSLNARF